MSVAGVLIPASSAWCAMLSRRPLTDRWSEQMQERLMADPETRHLFEELIRRLGGGAPPPEELD
jgi:hypothetical protein